MHTLRDVVALNWLYPIDCTKQEITNRFHFNLLRIMFIWLVVLSFAFYLLLNDRLTRQAMVDEQFARDNAAYQDRVARYNKLLENAEKKANITDKGKPNGTDEK